MKSTLESTADRSILHLRWSEGSEGWGGDNEIELTVINTSLAGRLEWIEGGGEGWNIWVFDEDADVQEEDILILEDHGLALYVNRVAEFTTLRSKEFHHYELVTKEHEESIATLKNEAGL